MTTTLQIKLDSDGYLENWQDWTPEIAEHFAAEEAIVLTERHWVVLNFVRAEFKRDGDAPTLRRITKQSDVKTKELYQLFPDGPAKKAARIAGLKKPTGCL